MSASVATLLRLARTHLLDGMFGSERAQSDADIAAHAYYNAAWLVAGAPARCDEWPGYAVWSAQQVKGRAA